MVTCDPGHTQMVLNALTGRLPILRPGLGHGALPRPHAVKAVSVSREVLRFVAGGLLAALLIGGGSFLAVTHAASVVAINSAETITGIGAHSVDALLTPGLLAGKPTDLAAFDQAVRQRVLNGRVVRVKVWAANGTIVYSDQAPLIGQHFELGGDDLAVLATGTPKASVSDLADPENRLERTYSQLLEVYVRTSALNGTNMLFETYQLDSAIQVDEQRVWSSFLPALAAGLLLMFAVQVSLAWRLARRLEHSGRDRTALLQRAIDSSDAERRRIASDLHDGPVQNLTAASLTLSAGATRLARPEVQIDRAALAEAMATAAQETRAAMTDLRSLIVEIAPPDLRERGLVHVLDRLLESARERGLEVRLDAPEELRLGAERTALIYRVAQECVRNVVKHAAATTIQLSLRQDSVVVLEVVDDGCGFSTDDLATRRQQGHVGLSLLEVRVAEAGASLTITSHPGEGTRVRLEIAK